MGRGHDSKHDGPTIYSPQMLALQGDSFCRLCDALSQLFAECSVPCEHLTAEIPIERLIFGIRSLSLVASSSNSARPLRFSSISVAPVATVKTTAKITTRGVLYFAMS
jgi:hypothetical protein